MFDFFNNYKLGSRDADIADAPGDWRLRPECVVVGLCLLMYTVIAIADDLLGTQGLRGFPMSPGPVRVGFWGYVAGALRRA